MSSLRQIAANRRNALKSTGPITAEGKERSRSNAIRHGLTAETVIATIEDQEDYQAFEAAVIADYDAETAVERELVLRLASILWRLRRATGIETALFESVAEGPHMPKHLSSGQNPGRNADLAGHKPPLLLAVSAPGSAQASEPGVDTKADIASCFLRLMDLPTFALDRLSRYERALWRQARQIVLTLQLLQRRKRGLTRSDFRFSFKRREPDALADDASWLHQGAKTDLR
jgi:hypothetical protein